MTDGDGWRQTPNVVLVDLEGSGGQDRDTEAILEVAAVRLVQSRPDLSTALSTLVNPRRRIVPGPWISPGLTDQALASAPVLSQVAPDLTARLTDAYLVGHNVGVDWRLLHRRLPDLRVCGLIDTLVLARNVVGHGKASLSALMERYELTERVNAAVPGGRPHRALWDAVAAGVLLDELVRRRWRDDPSLAALIAAFAPAGHRPSPTSLFEEFSDVADPRRIR